MDLFLAIRFDHEQGLGVHTIARKYGVHRRMVHQALASPVPPARKVPVRVAPVLGLWKAAIVFVRHRSGVDRMRGTRSALWARARRRRLGIGRTAGLTRAGSHPSSPATIHACSVEPGVPFGPEVPCLESPDRPT